jgi:UDP-N-acetylglucosamine--N-acetylmuramyl-(pentapeptide) pyrophosphoryl-undecaprenol N-acetylglucosamine transferase
MKVVIAAGGTGGHFYPGLAVAKALIREGNSVHFLVRKGDYVLPLLDRENIPYSTISASGFNRRMSLKHVLIPVKLTMGFLQSLFYFIKVRPALILVMGGYLSVPPALAARLLFIPVVLHEQNMKPGWANLILSFVSSKVAVSFKDSERYFKGQAVYTGNPIRPEFKDLPARDQAAAAWGLDPSKKTILVFGGSLGSKPLNTLMIEALSKLREHSGEYQILHFTGPSDESRVKEAYANLPFASHIEGYCHDMVKAYAASDLVISRAGASTISELLAVKRPAFLIPYPFATGGHQTANARVLVEGGVAQMVEEKNLAHGELKNHLKRFMMDPHSITRMQSSYDRMNGNPFQAADKILTVLQGVVKGPLINCWFV